MDAASGDSNAPGHAFGTFNPLKPSLTLHPSSSLKITVLGVEIKRGW